MALSEQEELEMLTLERERAAQRAAAPVGNVGGLSADGKIVRGALTVQQRLETLRAQLADPHRDPASEPELKREIARLEGLKVVEPAPAAPRAAQGDVRRAEPAETPKERQRVLEASFEAARKGWRRATGGVLKPGQTEDQAVAEWAKLPVPRDTREQSEAEHAAQTGELTAGDSVAYDAAKTLAGIGGFAVAGPGGATVAEGAVRATSLFYNLHNAIMAGMDADQAADIFVRELTKGAAGDAAWNYGVPLVGNLIAKIPGAKKFGDKVVELLKLRGTNPSVRDTEIAQRAAMTKNPARQEAVRELSRRSAEDFIPTPGQVKGQAGAVETVTNKAFPAQFKEQEKALGDAAEGMRRDLMYPGGQPSAQTLGTRIVEIADETVKKVKERLRPTFQAADEIGVSVDLSPLKARVDAALKADAAVPGGRLVERERAELKAISEQLTKNPNVTAEAALDFISRQKEKLRETTADYKPSAFFDTILNGLSKDADAAYGAAAKAAGKGDVVKNLMAARDDYGRMMETVYDDAMKTTLRKEGGGAPEDIGQFLWQNGKVSRIEQLDEMLSMATREGAAGKGYAEKLRRDVTRGFLQEAVKDVETAANWSKALAADPRKARTWDVLTAGPNGKALRDGMEVLEHAAQMATMRDSTKVGFFGIPLGRAAGGGLGFSWVTGAIHPGMAVTGLSIAGTMKLMSTAYVRGDKGTINLVAKVLRTNSAGTGASVKALQAMMPDLEEAAAKYGVDDIFTSAADEMVEAPPGYGSVQVPGLSRTQAP